MEPSLSLHMPLWRGMTEMIHDMQALTGDIAWGQGLGGC